MSAIDQRRLPAAVVEAAMEHHPDGELSTRITLAAALDALLADDEAMERVMRAYFGPEWTRRPGSTFDLMRAALTAAVQEDR